MARILICMVDEPGHLTSTFGLARALRERGHEVVYHAIPDMQPFVEHHGFPTVARQPALFPKGYPAYLERFMGEQYFMAIEWDFVRRKFEYDLGSSAERLAAINADLILCDLFLIEIGLTAHRLGIPLCMLNPMLPIRSDRGYPPLTSSVGMDRDWLTRESTRREQSFLRQMGAAYRFWATDTAAALSYCGYPADQFDAESALMPLLSAYPTIVLAPKALDFPRPSPRGVAHFSRSVASAEQPAISPELEAFVDPEKALIFASLGSQPFRYPHALRLFKALMEVVGARRDWQAILAVGSRLFDAKSFDPVPDNIRIVPHAPQVGLLRNARVFVTHGGINGMLEGIETQTPMLIVPQGYDQPGNAARLVHHGLGMMVPPNFADAGTIQYSLERLLADHSVFEARLGDMRAQVRAEVSANDVALEMVEGLLRKGGTPAPRSSPASAPPPGASALGWLFVDPGALPGKMPSLEAGMELQDGEPSLPAVGRSGFTAARTLMAALLRAQGPWLARVRLSGDLSEDSPDVAGRKLRVLWCADASEVLRDLKWWRLEKALENAALRRPELGAMLSDLGEKERRSRAHPHAAERAEVSGRLRELAFEYADPGCRILATVDQEGPMIAQAMVLASDILTECLLERSRRDSVGRGEQPGRSSRSLGSPLEEAERKLLGLVVEWAIRRFGAKVLDEELAGGRLS